MKPLGMQTRFYTATNSGTAYYKVLNVNNEAL